MLILACAVNEYVSICVFASLTGIPVSIASSAATTKICAIASVIKK